MNNVYVLVACECSQVVTSAFRDAGVIAFSCDLAPLYGSHPDWHIPVDCSPFLRGCTSFRTSDNVVHHLPRWDLIIAHPPCTYLSTVQSHLIFSGRGGNRVIVNHERYNLMQQAAEFFRLCLNARAPFVAVENPQINLKDTRLPRPDDCISPHLWGNRYSKRTWLWLKNLPPLIPGVVNSRPRSYVYYTRGSKVRSKFFPEVARAMAAQWLPIVQQYVQVNY